MHNILNFFSESSIYFYFRKTGTGFAQHLRVLAEELTRSADILDNTLDDRIDFFDEVNKKVSTNYVQWYGDEEK